MWRVGDISFALSQKVFQKGDPRIRACVLLQILLGSVGCFHKSCLPSEALDSRLPKMQRGAAVAMHYRNKHQ